MNETTPGISVVVPVYNEEKSLSILVDKLIAVLRQLPNRFEILLVNDGSQDGSLALLRSLSKANREVKVVDFRRNYGQTAALMAGIDYASNDIVVMIDADLQNDPADIPRLLAKLEEGYDVVSGWRRERRDSELKRNWISRIANRFISRVSGVKLHDYGCTLKVYRRSVVSGVRLYGEMHRFIPIYAEWQGARITELPVVHHARQFGASNYGMERVFKVVLDLLVVMFLRRYFAKPIYLFGGFGLISIIAAFATIALSILLRFVAHISLIQTPLPLLAALLFLVGLISILLGLVAEMLVRTYYESQGARAYLVRELINFQGDAVSAAQRDV
ncbi:glycosyltransferase family 2 protein [Bradyrhizobium yuanmingense]|uniref:glycosyltransferase family 2 protein n=1 Tax=Bradyrhizobium yuanmingense TaxID=108015 RepID=UPI0023B9768B|nr:glycosyltransferase family 2 protein [Bradyrhizobium yuanmingense]MDF0497954.1 glycosyltransferase family 2 protein [Bradyrhizobium yuanmingense]